MTHPSMADLRATVLREVPIVAAGVGSGLTARGAVDGGADVLAVYNTAVYRLRNLPSILAFLPGDDPNRITLEAAPEVVANSGGRPVLAGFGAHDPSLDIGRLLDQAAGLGVTGVTNEPFSGLYGEAFRQELERVGCGFSREVALIEAAARRALLTLGWACDAAEARRMAAAGADLVGLMLGITGQGSDQAELDAACGRIDAMAHAAHASRPDAILLVHGGPLSSPESVATVLRRCPVQGYVTGSSAERQPVLRAVAEAVRAFKAAGRGSAG